jgi:MPBQ/MSBQ methyltransferase
VACAQVLREIVTLERMHRAFASGLMEYGMAKAVKKGGQPTPGASSAAAQTSSMVSV